MYPEVEEAKKEIDDDIITAKYGVMVPGREVKLRDVYKMWVHMEEGKDRDKSYYQARGYRKDG